MGKMDEYVGCTTVITNKKNELYIAQPDLNKKIKKSFGEKIEGLSKDATPARH